MKTLTLEQVFENKHKILRAMHYGKVFVYPTDTVYGIGCNACNKKSVERIFDIKKRNKDKPVSVLAPSFGWIKKNCVVNTNLEKYLPGPFTLVLEKSNEYNLPKIVSRTNKIGVRIPKHKFTNIIHEANVPFITTSANFSGDKSAGSLKDIPNELLEQVDFVVDGGKLSGKPSKVIDLTKKNLNVLRD